MRILLIAIGSPGHYSQWNVLSCEALAGDLAGYYGRAVEVDITRADSMADSARVRLRHETYDIVGFSPSLGALGLMDRIWNRTQAQVVHWGTRPLLAIGNKVPTYLPEYCLERYPGSVVVRGEAEESMRGLVAHAAGRRPLESVPNLAYRAPDGVFRRTREERCDLQRLVYSPSTDTVRPVIVRGGNVLVQSSRGCPWSRCAYCTCRSFRGGREWEPLPDRRVLSNLQQLALLGAREFEFADDEFLGGRSSYHLARARKIGRAISGLAHEVGEPLSFRVFLEPTTIYRRGEEHANQQVAQLLSELKACGLSSVYMGVESGCPSQLERYNRHPAPDELAAALGTLRALDVPADIGFIMFDPWLTPEELIENIRFFRAEGLIEGNQWPFRPLVANEGAPIADLLRESGLLGQRIPEFMAYEYRFQNARIQRIHDAVCAVSEPSSSLFYALKTVSKTRFATHSMPRHVRLAKGLVKRNAVIYLQLMERLCALESESDWSASIAGAVKQVRHLIETVDDHVGTGRLPDPDGYLDGQLRDCLGAGRSGVADVPPAGSESAAAG